LKHETKETPMFRFLSRPVPLVMVLFFATSIPILTAIVKIIQVPAGLLHDESPRLAVAPLSMWLHAVSGFVFALLGPIQFARALKARFGGLHKVLGRLFVIAGVGMGLSGLSLLIRVDSVATPLLDWARAFFGAALIVALVFAVRAALGRNIVQHRAWIIRAYALGVGGPTVGLVMFPIYLAGGPVIGLVADIVFVGWWLVTIGIGEFVIAFIQRRTEKKPHASF
jgi:uncharacterized membrane protein